MSFTGDEAVIMPLSLTKTSSSIWRRLARVLTSRSTTTRKLIGILRLALVSAIIVGVMVPAPTRSQQQVGCAESNPSCPPARAKVDMAFIIDRSGSMANSIDDKTEGPGRGQAYNIELEGVRRALLDPTVIPPDGSIAVAVVLFPLPGLTSFPLVQFKEIDTAADAQSFADEVEKLKCVAVCDPVSTYPCPSGATFYSGPIMDADELLNQIHRPGARRVLLMSTDGKPSDLEMAKSAAVQARANAARAGIVSELDVILTGLSTSELEVSSANVNTIVFPAPPSDLPGAVFVIDRGVCNDPCAGPGCPDFDRQVSAFAEFTRRVLRSDVSTLNFEVTTDADTQPDTMPSANQRSLRQAIEQANCNGGSATITFNASLKDKTIRLLIPLPALRAPDIMIDGCDGPNCATSVTIAGPTDTNRGERHNDGLLIRSNHDVVRGLKIINFTRAGIAIDPVCQSDIVGHNQIEQNTLENNKVAGVLVMDPPSSGFVGGGVRNNPVAHNVGNTILGNTILDSLGCATPIDLGGEGLTAGRTDNDLCDTDEGPNTLLNFPRTMAVTRSVGSVTVTGSVCDPSCGAPVCPANLIGAVVEIFTITRFGTNCGAGSSNAVADVQADLDNRVITGVIPRATGTTDGNGSFTISFLGDSPTCGYTATVTDLAGNTSELMFPCAGFPKANISTLDIQFSPDGVPNGKPLSATFQVENQGCAPLSVASFSFTRDGFGGHKKGRDDDRCHFPITPIVGPNGIAIEPGQVQSFTVEFDPAIPRCLLSGEKLRADDTLPSTITSSLTLNHNGCVALMSTIKLIARVTTEVHLIDPRDPRRPPLVTLTRSGDELLASFAVFDSNRDVQKAMYELLDSAGRTVPLDNCCVDLTGIQNKYVAGQSFGVVQEFSNATNHPEVTAIRVTVFDKDGKSATATSGQVVNSNNTGRTQSLYHRQTGKLILSSTKIVPVFRKRTSR
jgi:hypothetical protein